MSLKIINTKMIHPACIASHTASEFGFCKAETIKSQWQLRLTASRMCV